MRTFFHPLVWGLLCITLPFSLRAQQSLSEKTTIPHIEWASEVLSYSSQYTALGNSAQQVLGEPNVPDGELFHPQAWIPANSRKGKAFIKVKFAHPMAIQQVLVQESFQHGLIAEIRVFDTQGQTHILFSSVVRKAEKGNGLARIFTEGAPYLVEALELRLQDAQGQPHGIDAIGIASDTHALPQKPRYNLDIDPKLEAKSLSPANSASDELHPVYAPNVRTLFFSRRKSPDNTQGKRDWEDIWYCQWEGSGWGKAQRLQGSLNTQGPNFIGSVTDLPQGGLQYVLGNVYHTKKRMRSGVSILHSDSTLQGTPRALRIADEYNLSEETNFFMLEDNKTLLMSVTRLDGHGNRDLYVSFLQADGNWSKPQNLGPQINTMAEESGPFMAADGRTLYFATNGRKGLGQKDIYMTKRLDDSWEQWSEPLNMGPVVNTSLDDLFFSTTRDGQRCLINREQQEGNADIYELEIPPYYQPDPVLVVYGQVINRKTGKPMNAQLAYERLRDGKEMGLGSYTPAAGDSSFYEIVLPAGELYGFRAWAEGFISVNEHVDLSNASGLVQLSQAGSTLRVRKDLYLAPLEVETPIVLNNVYFDFDKANLRQESFPELDRLASLLQQNPQLLLVEISGHCDSRGSDVYNLKLSARRAKSVADYLVSKGVESKRLTSLSYGKRRPLVVGDGEVAHQLNRRVEFKVLKQDNSYIRSKQ